MSTWVVQVAVVALFALACGALTLGWLRGRLGRAAIVLFGVALAIWVAAFLAIAAELRGANDFATCDANCAPVHYVRSTVWSAAPSRAVAAALSRENHEWRSEIATASRGGNFAAASRLLRPACSFSPARHPPERPLMASSFKLPDLGEGLTEGEIARWLVAEGQEIAEDDPLVEIQTDKATVEIPSPYAGTVLRILVAEGEIAPVGTQLVVIGDPGEEPSNNLLQAPARRAAPRVGQVTSCYKARTAARRRGERRRPRSSGGSRRSSASTSRRSEVRAQAGGSPRTTCAAPLRRCGTRGAASPCGASAA